MTPSHPRSQRFIRALETEFPGFRIVFKADSPLSRSIDVALRILTLGAQNRFLSHYHTVIGHTLFVPALWSAMSDVDRLVVLRHERIHLVQRRRYGFALFAFLYLIPILPLGLAYGRARLEWEAYRETLRATLELKGASHLTDDALRSDLIRRFTGPAYAWMWPFPRAVGRWFDDAVAELLQSSASAGTTS